MSEHRGISTSIEPFVDHDEDRGKKKKTAWENLECSNLRYYFLGHGEPKETIEREIKSKAMILLVVM